MNSRLLLIAGLLACPFTVSQGVADTSVNFSTISHQADFELTQPIISANVLSHPGKELLAFGVDDKRQRWLAIYGLLQMDNIEPQLVLLDKVILSHDLFRYDILDADELKLAATNDTELQTLYFLNSQALLQYLPASQTAIDKPKSANQNGRIEEVAAVNSITILPRGDFISRGDFVAHINNDAIADVIISDFRTAHLLLGTQQGEFARQSIPILPIVELTSEGAEYSQAPLYHTDINFDGLQDIVKVGEGMLEVFYQLPSGLFAANAEYLSVSQPISGVNWWNKRDAYGRPLDQSDLLYRKVEKIADIDGDKITDLVVRYTKSSGVFDRSNDYEIYLGSNDEGKLDFGREPSSIIRAEGTLTDLQFIDLDNDNRLEVLVSGFDIGVSQVIGALLSGSIDQDVYLFKMDQQSRFKDKANLTKQVQLNFSLTSGQSGKPVVTLGDLNGDGYDELILSNDDNELKVFFGQSGNIPFSKSNQTLTMTLPKEGSMVSLGDINLDGKDDILLQYGRQDDKALQRQIKVLLSQ